MVDGRAQGPYDGVGVLGGSGTQAQAVEHADDGGEQPVVQREVVAERGDAGVGGALGNAQAHGAQFVLGEGEPLQRGALAGGRGQGRPAQPGGAGAEGRALVEQGVPQDAGEQTVGDEADVEVAVAGAAEDALRDRLVGELAERLDDSGPYQVLAPGTPLVGTGAGQTAVGGGLQDAALGERGVGGDGADGAHAGTVGAGQGAVDAGEGVGGTRVEAGALGEQDAFTGAQAEELGGRADVEGLPGGQQAGADLAAGEDGGRGALPRRHVSAPRSTRRRCGRRPRAGRSCPRVRSGR